MCVGSRARTCKAKSRWKKSIALGHIAATACDRFSMLKYLGFETNFLKIQIAWLQLLLVKYGYGLSLRWNFVASWTLLVLIALHLSWVNNTSNILYYCVYMYTLFARFRSRLRIHRFPVYYSINSIVYKIDRAQRKISFCARCLWNCYTRRVSIISNRNQA